MNKNSFLHYKTSTNFYVETRSAAVTTAKKKRTMANSNDENAKETQNSEDIQMEDDDISEKTAQTGAKVDYIAKELREITLRFEFVVKNKEDLQLTMIRHIEVMRAFSECGGTDDIIVYDNKNNKVNDFYDPKWKDVAYYKSHFTMHSGIKKMGTSFYIIHRFRTNMSISTIKSDRKVFRALQSNEGYMKAHQWSEDVWKVQDIGFLLHYDPTKHPKEHVQTVLAEKFKQNGIKPKDVPPYKLVHSSPNTKVKGDKINAQAYSVQVESKNAAKMDKALKAVHKDNAKYVQYKMKGKIQASYARAIQEQARFVKSIAVVSMYGITEDMMFYLQAHLLEIEGVQEYLPTKATETKGKWNLIVARNKANDIKKILGTTLPKMVADLVDEESRRVPDGFPDPKVTPANEDGWNDAVSDGQNSYMSLCAQSYNSFEGDDTIDIDDTQYKTPTYANITKGTNSEQISDMTTPESGEIYELRAKVKSLEELIQQLTNSQDTNDSAQKQKRQDDPQEETPKDLPTERDMVEFEVTKRMIDIEMRMNTEIEIKMENSIQRAMTAMMEKLRMEGLDPQYEKDSDSESVHSQRAERIPLHQESKKRDRKTTPQKVRRAGRGSNHARNSSLHGGEDGYSLVAKNKKGWPNPDERIGMALDGSDNDSEESGKSGVKRSIFDDMDSEEGLLTQASTQEKENGTDIKRPPVREAKLKNV